MLTPYDRVSSAMHQVESRSATIWNNNTPEDNMVIYKKTFKVEKGDDSFRWGYVRRPWHVLPSVDRARLKHHMRQYYGF